jgi:hypothetical protein
MLLATLSILLSLVAARHAPARSGKPTFVNELNHEMPKVEVGATGAAGKGQCGYSDLISWFNLLLIILS